MSHLYAAGSPVLVVLNADGAMELHADDDEPPSLAANEDVARVARGVILTLDALGYSTQILSLVDDLAPLQHTLDGTNPPQLIFNLVESLGGDAAREPELPALLAARGIPFTGNSAEVLRRGLDKARIRALLAHHHIPTPRGVIAASTPVALREVRRAALRYPLFVKPACCDASIGISQDSVVEDERAMLRQVERLMSVGDGRSVIEEYLPGPEINVSIWPEPRAGGAAATLVDFSAFGPHLRPIVTYDCKWDEASEEYQAFTTPAAGRLPAATIERAIHSARRALLAAAVDSYARVDLRLDAHGEPRVIDLNANPDLGADSGLAVAARSFGVTYPALLQQIVHHALEAPHAAPRSTRQHRRSRSAPRLALAHP